MKNETIQPFQEQQENKNVQRKDLFEFKNGENIGKWIRLETENNSGVEGSFYESKNSNGKTILFFPGLPGDIVTLFENDYLKSLLEEGYSVFCARHEGLIYSENNDKYVNNDKRIEKSENIENSQASIENWLNESKIAIDYFGANSKVIMITHSFSSISGALSMVEAKKSNDNSINNLEKWLILSGSIWQIDNDNNLDKEKGLTKDALLGYIESLKENKVFSFSEESRIEQINYLISKLDEINNNISESIPKDLDIIGIYPKKDQLVSSEIGQNFFDKLPKGILINDEKEYETNPHDYIHTTPESLVRLVNMKTSGKHNFIVNK